MSTQPVDPSAIDLDSINNRLSQLAKNKLSKPYEKQKSSLHRELLSILALNTPKTLHSATPGDILKFLVWKDKAGKTKVHQTQCPRRSSDKTPSCSCPKRLAAGTVDSMIGKLRAIFTDAGLGGEWDDRLGIGNPVSHPSIKQYLKSVKEEEAKAGSRPKKAIPIFLGKLEKIAAYIFAELSAPRVLLSTFIPSVGICAFSFWIFSQGTAPQILGALCLRRPSFFPINQEYCSGKPLGKPFGVMVKLRLRSVAVKITSFVQSKILCVICPCVA